MAKNKALFTLLFSLLILAILAGVILLSRPQPLAAPAVSTTLPAKSSLARSAFCLPFAGLPAGSFPQDASQPAALPAGITPQVLDLDPEFPMAEKARLWVFGCEGQYIQHLFQPHTRSPLSFLNSSDIILSYQWSALSLTATASPSLAASATPSASPESSAAPGAQAYPAGFSSPSTTPGPTPLPAQPSPQPTHLGPYPPAS